MKRPRKRRHTIAPGIYRETNCYWAIKRMGSTLTDTRTRRQKFDLTTPISTMQAWQARQEAALLEARPHGPREGSLAADVPQFLAMVPTGQVDEAGVWRASPKRDDFRRLLHHWIDSPLGSLHRHEITREDILTLRSRWLERGAAAVTVNHRLRALRALYDGLDGVESPHPTHKIPNVKGPARANRGIPMHYVADILAAIPDRGRPERFGSIPTVSHTKIRLAVMAYTGIPPVQIERLRPRDLDLSQCVKGRGARVYLQPRRKAKGAPGAWVKLLPEAVTAFMAFAQADLWGKKFSRSAMGKSWKGAIRRLTATLTADAMHTKDDTALRAFLHAIPPKCRPYDLRHSFGTEAYRVTGDIRAVAELLQHADLETAKIYTGGAVSERVSMAIDKMDAARHEHITPPPPPKKRGRGSLKLVQTGSR